MLDAEEIARVSEMFGVSASQVRRDYLISHLLGLLSEYLADEILFFGGDCAGAHASDRRAIE